MAKADLHTAKRAARLFFTKWVDGAMSSSQNPPLPGGSTAKARHPTPPVRVLSAAPKAPPHNGQGQRN